MLLTSRMSVTRSTNDCMNALHNCQNSRWLRMPPPGSFIFILVRRSPSASDTSRHTRHRRMRLCQSIWGNACRAALYAVVSWWKIRSNVRSSSISSKPVKGLILGTTVLGIGGKDSPERGVARDEGIDVFMWFDRLLDRLRTRRGRAGRRAVGDGDGRGDRRGHRLSLLLPALAAGSGGHRG